jgi:hypothetical protein
VFRSFAAETSQTVEATVKTALSRTRARYTGHYSNEHGRLARVAIVKFYARIFLDYETLRGSDN